MYKNTMIKFNKAEDGKEGSASGYEAAPASEADPKSPAPPEASGDTDEFGYAKPPPEQSGKEGDGKKDEGKAGAAPEPKKEEQQDAVSGYSENPPKVDDPPPPAADPKKEEAPPKDEGLGYELEVKDLDPETAEQIKAFAKEHKLPESAAKAFVEMKKKEAADQAEFEKQKTIAIQKVKAGWHKELKEDKDFGGENFARNIHKVDKVLNHFMPETKKTLTEKGAMLPPYVMRDMSKIADRLFETENFVRGGEKNPSSKEDNAEENDPLDFYKT